MKLYDTKAVAHFLDITERQLRNDWVIAKTLTGLYDLLDTNRRYIKYLRKWNPESGESIDYDTERAKRKKKNMDYWSGKSSSTPPKISK